MLLVSTLICKETRKQNRFRRFQLNPGGPSKSGRIDSSGNRVSSVSGRKHPGNGFGTFTIEPMKVTELVPRVFPILNASPQAVACKWNESHTWSSGKNKEEVTTYDECVTFLQYLGAGFFVVVFFPLASFPRCTFLTARASVHTFLAQHNSWPVAEFLPGQNCLKIACAAGPMRAELNSPESRGQRLCCVRMLKVCGQGHSGLWTCLLYTSPSPRD